MPFYCMEFKVMSKRTSNFFFIPTATKSATTNSVQNRTVKVAVFSSLRMYVCSMFK